jgi:regulatory protein
VHEEVRDLLDDSQEDRFSSALEARKKAMDFLARREYGQQELIRKLAGKGFTMVAAEEAVGRLTGEGLQSDRRFAENFIQSRVNQGKGPVRIRVDLGQRGISEAAIDDALAEADIDWRSLAQAIRQKKFGRRRPADFKAKAQQMRFLQYRGFEQSHIQAAVGEDDD